MGQPDLFLLLGLLTGLIFVAFSVLVGSLAFWVGNADNLAAQLKLDPSLGTMPSYSSVRRFLKARGLAKVRSRSKPTTPGERQAVARLEQREVRSFEAEYVLGLWHLDFHHGSRKILTPEGEWIRPILLAILDDHSRLVCHAQWYLQETAESLIHGLVQACCKRGLPRALMTDNGSAMVATETTQGLERLSIVHETTLPYSPHQNGKQEVFWALVEGRLLAMLEGESDLTLQLLNTSTLAWAEMDYQRSVHSETGQKPLDRWMDGPTVARPCPSLDHLRLAFTARQKRTQRRSDGTISIAGTRFEVPSRFSHLHRGAIPEAAVISPLTGGSMGRRWPSALRTLSTGNRRSSATPLCSSMSQTWLRSQLA